MEKGDATAAVAADTRAGVSAGLLDQNKQTFTVKGVNFAKPADITLISEVLTPPTDPSSRAAASGDIVSVAYVGKHTNGSEFEKDTLIFMLGQGNVIKARLPRFSGRRVFAGAAPISRQF
jgi:FKBP-type peptidyl-prolyl cis-trans isomerase